MAEIVAVRNVVPAVDSGDAVKFGALPLDEAAGQILAHKLLDDCRAQTAWQRASSDLCRCRNAARTRSSTRSLSPRSTRTTSTKMRRRAASGWRWQDRECSVNAPGVGRANLIAEQSGPLRLNVQALERLNNIDEGITIATLREHTLVRPGDLLALVKIIPFAVPAAASSMSRLLPANNAQFCQCVPCNHARLG